MEIVGTAVDGVGVFIVAAGALVATARLLIHRAHNVGNYYSSFRQDIGRAILLGLEFFDCRRHYPNRGRRTDNSKRARPWVNRAHPYIPEFIAPTGNRRKIAVAPGRTAPRLTLMFADAVFTETALFCFLISCLNNVGRKFLGRRAIEFPLCRGAANTVSFYEISKKEAVK